MSFIVDPPSLFLSGELYARTLPESAQGRGAGVAGTLTTALFAGAAVAFYFDLGPTRKWSRRLGFRNGRDLMINTKVFDFEHRRPSARTHALSALALATYPLWWRLGWDHGRRRRPRSSA